MPLRGGINKPFDYAFIAIDLGSATSISSLDPATSRIGCAGVMGSKDDAPLRPRGRRPMLLAHDNSSCAHRVSSDPATNKNLHRYSKRDVCLKQLGTFR